MEKNLKFVLDRRDDIIIFNLGLVLLSAEVDSISKKQSREEDTLRVYAISHIKIVLALLTEIIVSYVEATMIQVQVPAFKGFILGCKICFTIFLTFDKQF